VVGLLSHDWAWRLAWQGKSIAIGVRAADGADCRCGSVELTRLRYRGRCCGDGTAGRASGLTVLIIEQNVRQLLQVVDRVYRLEAGSIRASAPAPN
jgi:hypothetical protein